MPTLTHKDHGGVLDSFCYYYKGNGKDVFSYDALNRLIEEENWGMVIRLMR